MSTLIIFKFKHVDTEKIMTFKAYSEKSAKELLALATEDPERWVLQED